MFLEFYGLKEQPFGVTPDPRFIYPSRTYSKAFNSLSCGIEAGCGFLALIARPGMGKTTLVLQLLKELEQTSRAILLFRTQDDSRELLRDLLSALGLDAAGQDIVGMHERLDQRLACELLAGRRFVLILDESQNLDNSVLEAVRLLSDFETPTRKLMQIIFAGRTQLADKLSSPDLLQLRQRISILSRLEPLTRAETVCYIEHRLQVAGYAGAPLFTSGALEGILAHSEGIPRTINNLCFNALHLGYAAARKQIDAAIVDQVLSDLEMNPLDPECVVSQQVPLALPRTPIILYPGSFKADLDPQQGDANDVEEGVIEFEVILTEPVPEGP
jgi:general secretion pathway protein A